MDTWTPSAEHTPVFRLFSAAGPQTDSAPIRFFTSKTSPVSSEVGHSQVLAEAPNLPSSRILGVICRAADRCASFKPCLELSEQKQNRVAIF